MSVWQYGQLTITVDTRTPVPTRTVLWRGPGATNENDLSESEQSVLELLNKLGADGWELAGIEEDRKGGSRGTDWGATWSLVAYIFKRPCAELHAV